MADGVMKDVDIMVHLQAESLEEEEHGDVVMEEVDLMIIIRGHI